MMTTGRWRIGLHIQQDSIRAVALTQRRGGLELRRWWHIPVAENLWREGRITGGKALVEALRDWRA